MLSHLAKVVFVIAVMGLLLAGCSDKIVDPPPAPVYDEIAVNFTSDGLELQGTLFSPRGRTDSIGVVIINGSGPVDRDGTYLPQPNLVPPVYLDWADRLASEKIAVLRYDKRFITHSQLDPLALDQNDQIADAVAAVNYLASRSEVSASKIFVIGHSEGGNLAAEVAKATDAAGIVIIAAPAFPIDELVIEQLQANPNNPQALIDEVSQAFQDIRNNQFPTGGSLLGAGEAYWRQWIDLSTSAVENVREYNRPALFLQGCNDQNFPGGKLERNKAIWENAADTTSTLTALSFEEVDHFLIDIATDRTASEVMDEIFLFIAP